MFQACMNAEVKKVGRSFKNRTELFLICQEHSCESLPLITNAISNAISFLRHALNLLGKGLMPPRWCLSLQTPHSQHQMGRSLNPLQLSGGASFVLQSYFLHGLSL